jgi:hypothetical protein
MRAKLSCSSLCVLYLFTLAGCIESTTNDPSSNKPKPRDPKNPNNPTSPTDPTPQALSGTVRASAADGGAPIADASVEIIVQANSMTFVAGTAITDNSGKYSVSLSIPSGSVVGVHAVSGSFMQPCMSIGSFSSSSLVLDIEMYNARTLYEGTPIPPNSSMVLSGVVRDLYTNERSPGALIQVQAFPLADTVSADTYSTATGAYFLCKLTSNILVRAYGEAHPDGSAQSFALSGDTVADILLY